ncbi:antitoxin VbhA family protein [Azorhizobium sp. AG788]|uniref:antitoxin VbhA family protein n=1 Tax=Azorhizobium sp. AG788 TaxID=2183897 RepID=UPI003138EB36
MSTIDGKLTLRRREEIVRDVIADARIEGMDLSDTARSVLDDWAAGTISTEELRAWKLERIRLVKEANEQNVRLRA